MASALGSVGSDLSVSISFSIAGELLALARESQVSDEELVSVLFALVVAVTSSRKAVSKLIADLSEAEHERLESVARAEARSKNLGPSETDALILATTNVPPKRGLLEFALLLLRITQSIVLSISVQVLAYSVRASASTRVLRITSLCGMVVFFLFFEASTQRRL